MQAIERLVFSLAQKISTGAVPATEAVEKGEPKDEQTIITMDQKVAAAVAAVEQEDEITVPVYLGRGVGGEEGGEGGEGGICSR